MATTKTTKPVAEMLAETALEEEPVVMEELHDELTAAVAMKQQEDTVPRVRVYLPLLEDTGTGLKVDQYEHVTINGETTLVKRGEYVDVTVPVYIQLRNRFPGI